MSADVMDQTQNLMSGMDVDMLPLDIDMAMADQDSQNFAMLTSQSQQARSQQHQVSAAEANDSYALTNTMTGADRKSVV